MNTCKVVVLNHSGLQCREFIFDNPEQALNFVIEEHIEKCNCLDEVDYFLTSLCDVHGIMGAKNFRWILNVSGRNFLYDPVFKKFRPET